MEWLTHWINAVAVDWHEKKRKKVAVGYGSVVSQEGKLFIIASYGKCSMEGQGGKGNFWQKVVICAQVRSGEHVWMVRGHTKTIDVNENAVFFVSKGPEQQESSNGGAIR